MALAYDMRFGRLAEARVFARFYASALSLQDAGPRIATRLQQPLAAFGGPERIQELVSGRMAGATCSACTESKAIAGRDCRTGAFGQKIKLIPRFSLHR
jgi:hypothetical protein